MLTAKHGGPWGGRRGRKTAILTPKKVTLGNWGCKMARRAAKRPPTQKPKVSRVTLGYGGDMIPSSRVRPSPKKGGYMGEALKKADFWAKNAVCWPQINFSETSSNFLMPSWQDTKKATFFVDCVARIWIYQILHVSKLCRTESSSLSESTRQITAQTIGHAPPPPNQERAINLSINLA